MKDEVFGVLNWTYHDCWEGIASFEYLSGYGTALDEQDPPRNDSAGSEPPEPTQRQAEAMAELEAIAGESTGDEARLMKAILDGARKRLKEPRAAKEIEDETVDPTKVELMVETNGRRKKPSTEQRHAWQKFLSRGEALWMELLEKAVELYNRQRPMRVKIWEGTYGQYGLRRCLPEVANAEQMKRLVRPYLCRVMPPSENGSIDIGLRFGATWHMDGFGARVRDGQVVEVGHPQLSQAPGATRLLIDHPVFGRLARNQENDMMGRPQPWEGLVRCDPLLEYCWVAPTRAQFVHHDRNADKPRSAVAWEFAGGEFEVRVYAGSGQQPDEAQARAWAAFRADESRHVAEMMATMFQMYQEVCEVRRRAWRDRYVDDVVPILDSPEPMRDLVQMRCVHVHPPDAEGHVTIAFQFVCSWDTDGLSALWRDGKVQEWGVWKDAKPV